VELDATHAGTVVGDSVTLGPDAEVDVVYTDDLDGADATVGDVRPREEYWSVGARESARGRRGGRLAALVTCYHVHPMT